MEYNSEEHLISNYDIDIIFHLGLFIPIIKSFAQSVRAKPASFNTVYIRYLISLINYCMVNPVTLLYHNAYIITSTTLSAKSYLVFFRICLPSVSDTNLSFLISALGRHAQSFIRIIKYFVQHFRFFLSGTLFIPQQLPWYLFYRIFCLFVDSISFEPLDGLLLFDPRPVYLFLANMRVQINLQKQSLNLLFLMLGQFLFTEIQSHDIYLFFMFKPLFLSLLFIHHILL